jgi:2-succinyl-5-enolpyruvyl-6-hydroxy-3-cyclohexene-1-carboxylate synthase
MEADLARVPIIVCTADRPPELHRVGAPQTIEQVAMFGGAVRFATAPGVPEEATRPYWRSEASRLVAESTSGPAGPGPVHANLAFREPLVGAVESLPAPRQMSDTWHRVIRGRSASVEAIEALCEELWGAERGCFVVGGNLLTDGSAITDLARGLGWPVLSDGRALRREISDIVVAHADQILRSTHAASALLPDLVVHVGSPHASKTVSQWCEVVAQAGARQVLIDPFASFEDPERLADVVLGADPAALCTAVSDRLDEVDRREDGGWLSLWQDAPPLACWRSCSTARRASPSPGSPVGSFGGFLRAQPLSARRRCRSATSSGLPHPEMARRRS